MKRVYVAGAYSADNVLKVFENMRAGMVLAREVLDAGYAPFVPWFDYHFSMIAPGMTLQQYYNYSMAWLEASDAMILVPGWETSNGTKAEIARARELKIPIYISLEDLKRCLNHS